MNVSINKFKSDFKLSHRKVNGFYAEYAALVTNGKFMYPCVRLRLYATENRRTIELAEEHIYDKEIF